LPYSTEELASSLASLDRLYTAKETALEIVAKGQDVPIDELGELHREVYGLAMAFPSRFYQAMDDDFGTAEALGPLFELVRAVNRFGNDKKARAKGVAVMRPALRALEIAAEVLGVGGMDPVAFFDEVKTKRLAAAGRSVEEVEARIAARAAARAAKDWAEADRLRGELDADGILVMDNPTGSTWRMRVE
jgi:cysteinyl-tRNA synthetase